MDVMKNSLLRRHSVSLTHTHVPFIYVWVFTLHLIIILFWVVPYCQCPGDPEGQLGKHQADHPCVALRETLSSSWTQWMLAKINSTEVFLVYQGLYLKMGELRAPGGSAG